jgi:hypothetical protein
MKSSQLLSWRLQPFLTVSFVANPETHDGQGLIKVHFDECSRLRQRVEQVQALGIIILGSSSRPQTGGQTLANEASIEGRFRFSGKSLT